MAATEPEIAQSSADDVGRHLRALRKARGLSRSEVARSSGLTRRELAAYERGKASVPETDLWCLAGSCGVDVTELLPTRDRLGVDADLAALTVGESVRRLRAGATAEGVLREYLSMIYELRNLPPGTKPPMREEDLAVLADALGGDAASIEERLHDLIGASRAEATRLRTMILPPRQLESPSTIGTIPPGPSLDGIDSEIWPASGATVAGVAPPEVPLPDYPPPVFDFEPAATIGDPDAAERFFGAPRVFDPFAPPPPPQASTVDASPSRASGSDGSPPQPPDEVPTARVEPGHRSTPPADSSEGLAPGGFDPFTAPSAPSFDPYAPPTAPPIDPFGSGTDPAPQAEVASHAPPVRFWEVPELHTDVDRGLDGFVADLGPADPHDLWTGRTGGNDHTGGGDLPWGPAPAPASSDDDWFERADTGEVDMVVLDPPWAVPGAAELRQDGHGAKEHHDDIEEPVSAALDPTDPFAALRVPITDDDPAPVRPEVDGGHQPAEPDPWGPPADEIEDPWLLAPATLEDTAAPNDDWFDRAAAATSALVEEQRRAARDEDAPDTARGELAETAPDEAPAATLHDTHHDMPDGAPVDPAPADDPREALSPIAWSLSSGASPATEVAVADERAAEDFDRVEEDAPTFVAAGHDWQIGGLAPATSMHDDGALALRRADVRWALADLVAEGDFTLRASFDFTSGPGFGILFRVGTEDDGTSSGYSFDVDPIYSGGGLLLRRWTDSRPHWQPLAHAPVADGSRLYGSHVIEIDVRGDALHAMIDGEAVMSVPELSRSARDAGHPPCGGVGVGVQAWSTTEVTIRRLLVADR